MSRRTLSLAAAVLGMSALSPAAAQNLEAGKSPAQIFAATCAICHKSPHGLLKSVSPGALPGFLRQHYTTSVSMAGAMSAYVLSNGAANRRAGDDLTREGRELTSPKPREREAEPRERQERRIDAEKPPHGHAAKPKEEGSSEAGVKEKKPKADKRKPKTAPVKDEPKAAAQPKPEAPAAESKPAAAPSSPAEPAAQPEPKPAASAPEAPAKKPDEDKPASNMPVFNVAPKADAKSETAPAAPAADKPAESPPAAQ
jgi:hypothetical protein